ncbi:MAG TPA: cytochrome c biogenesis protein CcsA [Candidatus Thermoplasmatota archaeon]|nr:cytochrome c biogenesis protein CcsA [Candidatus Thermoplasmatota archaeon]
MKPGFARALAAAGVLAVLLDLAIALVVAPPAANFDAPLSQRLFYIHVPAAIAAYVGFTLTMLAGVQFLRTRDARWDRLAASSAEVGALLTTIALLTGILWSRVEFFSAGTTGGFAFALLGDPKFVTTAALWLVFLGYLALRRGVERDEARARLSAVYGILGYVGVPLSYLSSRFSPHPDFLARGSSLAPGLGALLWGSVVLWLLVLAALVANRLSLEERAHASQQEREAALLATGGEAA